jgi:hypothetical protein
MGARSFLTVVIVAAAVPGVAGQTTAADGVAALARGDYQLAVEILKPIADDWRSNDQAAQFFMAGLYETGRGVTADPLRACALYMRAAAVYDRPFGQEASALFGFSINRGQEFNDECQRLANVGFDHGFEPVTFNLEPGQFVELTLAAAKVNYDGRTKPQPMGYAQPGARFLPVRHTELATGPTRSITRHFIEVFVWYPVGRTGPWNLYWHLLEVVRDEIVSITVADSLATAGGDEPPSRENFDTREYAAVRVDDAGHAEWAVLKGPHPGTQRIATDAERREVRDTSRARAEALKGVDWNQRPDVKRQPTMRYMDAEGCGHVQLYGWTADRAEAVVVRFDGRELRLTTGPASFDLSRDSVNLAVEAYVYDMPQQRFDFCSDARVSPGPDSVGPEIWAAVAGRMTIELSSPGIRAHNPNLRRATVTLSNVVLRNSAGTTVNVSGPVRLTAVVGGGMGG